MSELKRLMKVIIEHNRTIEQLQDENAELFLADQRNTEICEAQDKRIVELSNARIDDAWTITEQAKEIERLKAEIERVKETEK